MRRLAGIVLTAALLAGMSACGDDGDDMPADGDQAATEFVDLKPEDVRASPAEVADGFRELNRYSDELLTKLGSDDAAATELQERLLTIWESILGTVKANDDAAYQKLDEALSSLMTAGGDDKTQAQEAADTIEETSEEYLERVPGSGSPASSSPLATPEDDADPDSDSDVQSDVDPPISY